MSTVEDALVAIDGPVTVELSPGIIAELFTRLDKIDRQGQNAITGKNPVSGEAIFINVDEIVKLLTNAEPTGRLANYHENLEGARRQEAAAKLAGQ